MENSFDPEEELPIVPKRQASKKLDADIEYIDTSSKP